MASTVGFESKSNWKVGPSLTGATKIDLAFGGNITAATGSTQRVAQANTGLDQTGLTALVDSTKDINVPTPAVDTSYRSQRVDGRDVAREESDRLLKAREGVTRSTLNVPSKKSPRVMD